MTFAALRALHAIIGDALDEIEGVYAAESLVAEPTSPGGGGTTSTPLCGISTPRAGRHGEAKVEPEHIRKIASTFAYASPPPSPSVANNPHHLPPPLSDKGRTTSTTTLLDFPSLDNPCDPLSPPELLTAHPTVLNAIKRMVSAAGQMTAIVQAPFLTICDSTMGYHLPSCMRMLEASHIVEILREAGPGGLHVDRISRRNGVDPVKLAHILRLLATHHILREVSPNVFTLNRISSLIDSGKLYAELEQFQTDGRPELKYQGSNGIAAFVGLCTDEIQKASAYMTEAYHLSPSHSTREGREPTKAPFCFAFDTVKSRVGYFGWLEGSVEEDRRIDEVDVGIEMGQGREFGPVRERPEELSGLLKPYDPTQKRLSNVFTESSSASEYSIPPEPFATPVAKSNRFRLERFGKAMSGTEFWETPGTVLNAFDWHSLPADSTVVDVGGGIGSTTMLLATSFSSADERVQLNFIIQDRPPVVEMGEQAWKDKLPMLLNRSVRFQVHDFFLPQPVQDAAVFLLRVVLHDWPYKYALKILQQLRDVARPSTKLLIGDFILPLACPEDVGADPFLKDIQGAERLYVPPPLLPNMGKANANVYWMDLTMQTMFNAQERTLREMAQLTLAAGWKIVKVVTCTNSSFSYLTAVPVPVAGGELATPVSIAPEISSTTEDPLPNSLSRREGKKKTGGEVSVRRLERASSRCGTPTFGSRTKLSSAFEEALAKIGGGFLKGRVGRGSSNSSPGNVDPKSPTLTSAGGPVTALKPALTLTPRSTTKKEPRSTTLSIIPPPPIPPPVYNTHTSPTLAASPRRREETSPALLSTSTGQQRSPVPRLIKKCVSLAQLKLGQGANTFESPTPSGTSSPNSVDSDGQVPSLLPFSFNSISSASGTTATKGKTMTLPALVPSPLGRSPESPTTLPASKVAQRRASHALLPSNNDTKSSTLSATLGPSGSIAFPSSTRQGHGCTPSGASGILGSSLRVLQRRPSFMRPRAHSRQVSSTGATTSPVHPQPHSPDSGFKGDTTLPNSTPPPPPIPPRSMRRTSLTQLTLPLRIRSKSVVQPVAKDLMEDINRLKVPDGEEECGGSKSRKESGSLAAVMAGRSRVGHGAPSGDAGVFGTLVTPPLPLRPAAEGRQTAGDPDTNLEPEAIA